MKNKELFSPKCIYPFNRSDAFRKFCGQFEHAVGVVAARNLSARGIVNGIYLLIKQSILQIKHMFLHIKIELTSFAWLSLLTPTALCVRTQCSTTPPPAPPAAPHLAFLNEGDITR